MGGQTFPEAPTCHLPGVDDAGKSCWHQFLESSTAVFTAVNDRLVEVHQLTMIDVLLLDVLAKSPRGSAPMSVLGDALVLTPSRVTQQVTRLQGLGLVHRGPGTGDRRRVVATVTALGRARLEPALATYANEIRRTYLDPLSHQQAIALGDACRRVSPPTRPSIDRQTRNPSAGVSASAARRTG